MSYLRARIAARGRQAPRVATQTRSVPASSLGWNARDDLSDMDPRFALVMDNYFPDGSDVRLRLGNVDWVTGISGPVETLHTAAFGTTRRLVAFANNASYDVTGSGVVGAPLASGFTDNRWIGINAGASGGERALYTNGIDAAQSWDRTTWQAAGFTGPSKPTGIALSHKRVWVIENGTGEAWYSPPEAVTGALAAFDIGSVHPEGGNLLAIGTLTLDGGLGSDDATVFIMQSGAVVVYVGTDPADAANWSLRGVWKAGNPIGERCLVPFDKDLILITDIGFQSILRFTVGGGISGVPISDNIRTAVGNAAKQYRNNFGWNGLYNPAERQLIFNIPILTDGASYQYVMNSVGLGWCRFVDTAAICHAVRDQKRYIGVDGKVMQADTGGADGTQPIVGTAQSAWNYFGSRGQQKKFKQARVNIRSDSVVNLSIGLGVDFKDPSLGSSIGSGGSSGAQWNVDKWNVSRWASGLTTVQDWRGAFGVGYNASLSVRTQTTAQQVQLLASDFIYELGGAM